MCILTETKIKVNSKLLVKHSGLLQITTNDAKLKVEKNSSKTNKHLKKHLLLCTSSWYDYYGELYPDIIPPGAQRTN